MADGARRRRAAETAFLNGVRHMISPRRIHRSSIGRAQPGPIDLTTAGRPYRISRRSEVLTLTGVQQGSRRMASIVVCASGVANFPDGGGHFWVYMQYVQSLRRLGCDVYWLERFHPTRDRQADAAMQKLFFARMDAYGLRGRAMLYSTSRDGTGPCEYVGASESSAAAVFRHADLLLNFEYRIDGRVLAQ